MKMNDEDESGVVMGSLLWMPLNSRAGDVLRQAAEALGVSLSEFLLGELFAFCKRRTDVAGAGLAGIGGREDVVGEDVEWVPLSFGAADFRSLSVLTLRLRVLIVPFCVEVLERLAGKLGGGRDGAAVVVSDENVIRQREAFSVGVSQVTAEEWELRLGRAGCFGDGSLGWN